MPAHPMFRARVMECGGSSRQVVRRYRRSARDLASLGGECRRPRDQRRTLLPRGVARRDRGGAPGLPSFVGICPAGRLFAPSRSTSRGSLRVRRQTEGGSCRRQEMNERITRMLQEVERRGGLIHVNRSIPDDVAQRFMEEVLACPNCPRWRSLRSTRSSPDARVRARSCSLAKCAEPRDRFFKAWIRSVVGGHATIPVRAAEQRRVRQMSLGSSAKRHSVFRSWWDKSTAPR